MKILIFLTILYSSICQAEIYLAIGESHKLPAPSGQLIEVDKKSILKVKDLGSKILITGKKLGEASIKIGNKAHKVHVIKKPHFQTLKALSEWIENKRGPEIKVINNQVQIHGRLLRVDDFYDLKNFAHSQSKFSFNAKLDPLIHEEVLARLKNLLSENNLPEGAWSLNPHFSLSIGSSLKSQLSQYKKILNPFGVEVKIDSAQFAQAPLVEIKIYIAHIKKNFLRNWGMSWPGSFSAQVIPGLQMKSFELSLQALESQGWGKTLASPTVVTESGHKAEFHSGGEFPIQTSTQFSNSVEWKRYGLSLKTKPRLNAKKHLSVEIDIELSALDLSQSQNGIPALNRNQLKTKINLKELKPFVLSGFLQQVQQNSSSGLPWLKQIPIFSPLFSNGLIYDDDFELIFLMVPQIYES